MSKNASSWTIHKFGGSSLKDTNCFYHVSDIILNVLDQTKAAVVVSAVYGVTNTLHDIITLAQKQDLSYQTKLTALLTQHRALSKILCESAYHESFQVLLTKHLQDITAILSQLKQKQTLRLDEQEFIVGHGELWSAQLLTGLLKKRQQTTTCLDTREFLIVSHESIGPVVNWVETNKKFDHMVPSTQGSCLVFTGYIARTISGQATTLQRNGSDHTASILSYLMKANEVHIWTDVNGVYTADPNKIKRAKLLSHMSYHEVAELAYFGSHVLHPKAMVPVIDRGIPMYIRNTFNPTSMGTKISTPQTSTLHTSSTSYVKGFSSIDRVSLISVEGRGMVGVPGIAKRLFDALSRLGVSVIMISQASSEYCICLAVHESDVTQSLTSVISQ